MPLNEMELNQLQSAVEILSHFQGMPQFEWIQELLPKLQQGTMPEIKQPIIAFDNNQYLKGIEHLGTLYNSIFYQKVLSIRYHPFNFEQPQQLTIHPYHLKQYNNRWFLFGYNPEANITPWNLALDRIQEIKEIKGRYKKNKEIDWNEYFEDILGVTKPIGEKEERVILHFFGKTGKYIETKPLHSSQHSKWLDKDVLEVRMDLILNYELERTILSYAGSVNVIQPEKLHKTIIEKLKNVLLKLETK